jgi:hypothetical protein
MDLYAYIGEAISGLVYLFVGVRLFMLSRRTGHTPETLIAVSFLLWVLAYAFYDIPYAFVGSEELIPAACSFASLVALASGNVVFAFFIRAVFRSDALWATWLVAAVALSNLVGVTGAAWVGDWEGTNPLANPWYWVEFFGSFAPTLWMGAEGYAKYFKTRKQLALGLCDPMSCNRFLLWGLAGSIWLVLEGVIAGSDLVYAYTGEWSASLGAAIGLLEVVPFLAVGFVFFPPDFYCRWIEGSTRAESELGQPVGRSL